MSPDDARRSSQRGRRAAAEVTLVREMLHSLRDGAIRDVMSTDHAQILNRDANVALYNVVVSLEKNLDDLVAAGKAAEELIPRLVGQRAQRTA